jgi:hypothetical protein
MIEIVNQFLKMFTLLLRFFDEEIYTSIVEVPKIMFNSLFTEFTFSGENEVNLTESENEKNPEKRRELLTMVAA